MKHTSNILNCKKLHDTDNCHPFYYMNNLLASTGKYIIINTNNKSLNVTLTKGDNPQYFNILTSCSSVLFAFVQEESNHKTVHIVVACPG